MTRIPSAQPFSYLVWVYAWTVADIREVAHMSFEEMAARFDPEPDDLFYVDFIEWDGRIRLKQPIRPVLH